MVCDEFRGGWVGIGSFSDARLMARKAFAHVVD